MRALRWLGAIVIGIALLIGALVLYAPFHDRPRGLHPGRTDGVRRARLRTRTGLVLRELGAANRDAARRRRRQVANDLDPRARRLGVHPVHVGLFSGEGHHLAVEDGRALVRVEAKRYLVTLRKVEDPQLLESLAAANSAKYPPAPGSDEGSWYLRLEHRNLLG